MDGLDEDYYKAACKRYQTHAAQASLFDPVELTKATETTTPELFDQRLTAAKTKSKSTHPAKKQTPLNG